jgi:hypothetical protein
MVAEGHFRRKREAPLTVEGCRRTLSGPSPDPSMSTALHFPGCVVVVQVVTVKLSAGCRRWRWGAWETLAVRRAGCKVVKNEGRPSP